MKKFLLNSRLAQRHSEKGAALITVVVALAIVTLILFEFQYNTLVEQKLAYNQLEQLQSYYLAKSGARIGLLRVNLYARALKDPGLKSIAKDVGDLTPYLNYIWSLPMPPFPPDREDLSNMFKADKDAAEKALEQTQIENGKFIHTIRSESNKINLNFLVTEKRPGEVNFNEDPTELFAHVGKLLINLVEGFVEASDDPFEEYGDIKPDEIVFNLMDWVNPGDESFAGGSKDAFYERQDPPYKAKRNRFYTLNEVKLVRDINSKLFRKLKPHITVYSEGGKININDARANLYRAFYSQFTEDDVTRILQYRDEIGGWSTVDQFVKYVSEEIGYSGFEELYKDKNNRPFTIGTQSFVIESTGLIQKSASMIQRRIEVAVALTSSNSDDQPPRQFPEFRNKTECEKNTKSRFWHNGVKMCIEIPRTPKQCELLPGEVRKQGEKTCCQPPKHGVYCPPDPDPNQEAAKKDFDAMKVLSWTES